MHKVLAIQDSEGRSLIRSGSVLVSDFSRNLPLYLSV